MSSVIYGSSNILKDNKSIWTCQGTKLHEVLHGAKYNLGQGEWPLCEQPDPSGMDIFVNGFHPGSLVFVNHLSKQSPLYCDGASAFGSVGCLCEFLVSQKWNAVIIFNFLHLQNALSGCLSFLYFWEEQQSLSNSPLPDQQSLSTAL